MGLTTFLLAVLSSVFIASLVVVSDRIAIFFDSIVSNISIVGDTFVVGLLWVDWSNWFNSFFLGQLTTSAAVIRWVVISRRGELSELLGNITILAVLLGKDGTSYSSLGGSPSSGIVADSLLA
jgi:hypothetical protein